jgi:Predicted N-acetylglucosamine kinase
MKYFMGIDQGGSKTAAIIGDEHGHILGVGKSFGAVHSVAGMEKAMQASKNAFDEALMQAGLNYSDIYGIYGGMSGIDWDYETDLIVTAMQDTFSVPRVSIVNDCLIAMRAATDSDVCATICAGSGVNCAVRNGKNQIVFGYYIPDNIQGGISIGVSAVQKVFDAEAGVDQETILTEYITDFFKVSTVDELLQKRVNGEITSADYLKLPLTVEKAALEGDAVAKRIFENFAKGIVPYVHAGMKKLGIQNSKVDVVLSGSIFKCKERILRETVETELKKEAKNANIIDAIFEPIVGAYLMGLDSYLGKPSEEIYQAIKSKQLKYNLLRK